MHKSKAIALQIEDLTPTQMKGYAMGLKLHNQPFEKFMRPVNYPLLHPIIPNSIKWPCDKCNEACYLGPKSKQMADICREDGVDVRLTCIQCFCKDLKPEL